MGLQVSYLVWGIMQELIMDSTYEATPHNPTGKFPSATFCVFSNRFLAIIVAAIVCRIQHGTVQSSAPLWYFTPCALSNTISSWSQYQALSFVSFSLQTLFKATKVIPVMVMGRLLKGTQYSAVEYLEAVLITGGVAMFSLSSRESKKGADADGSFGVEAAGFMLLTSYVMSDSFTSQWQSRIYRDYGKIDHYHMMCVCVLLAPLLCSSPRSAPPHPPCPWPLRSLPRYGVNCSSIIFTVLALVFSGDLPRVIEFMMYNPTALWYNVLTAITSTTGQIAIFYTIKRFGPVVFTIIMTTRQMMSIVLSTILFGHKISGGGVIGALCVFAAIFHSVYRQTKEKKDKAPAAAPAKAGEAKEDQVPLLAEERKNDEKI